MNNALQNFNHNLNLACILANRGIELPEINDIEVIDVEIVQESNVERFYKWLQRCGNIHLNDHEQVTNAFRKIINYE